MELKREPEDFRVRELMDLDVKKDGKYAYYKLWKRGWNTVSACRSLAKAMKRPAKVVNFAGNKDKDAVTEQFVSVLNGQARDFELLGIKAEYLGRGDERINLGTLKGNHFEIAVRGIDKKPKALEHFPNYFDEQRFGRNLDNHLVGRLILLRKFEEAVGMIPEVQDKVVNNNYFGALRMLPKMVLRFYLHSYQSWVWNRTVSRYLERFRHREMDFGFGKLNIPLEKVDDMRVPVAGYDTGLEGEIGDIVEGILKGDGMRKGLFSIRSIPEADLKGTERDMLAKVSDLEIGELEEDELNPGKKKCLVRFTLPPGSYATLLLKILFSQQYNSGYGSS